MKAIRSKIGTPEVFVFSDDLAWCRENLSALGPMEFVDCGSDIGDFRHMTLCRHHVISNSTFAWWAAYLASHPDQMVVAPSKWSFVEDRDEKDLFPKGWALI